ncbi:hypothetical protein GCM10023324_26780 [Streptomyces youssoufiensis]
MPSPHVARHRPKTTQQARNESFSKASRTLTLPRSPPETALEWRIRRTLEEAGVGYVLAVPKSQQFHAPSARIDHAIAQVPEEVWERLSRGEGAKGPRVYDWAAVRLPAIDVFDGDAPTHERWMSARHSQARPDEIVYYLAYAPNGTVVGNLAWVARVRWAIEEAFQAAKNECGLDQCEVRRWLSWLPRPLKKGAAETTPPAPSPSRTL